MTTVDADAGYASRWMVGILLDGSHHRHREICLLVGSE